MSVLVIPSLLEQSSLEQFQSRARQLRNFTNWLQLDVCDGQFVSTKTIDLGMINPEDLPENIEYHLMVQDPLRVVEQLERLRPKRIAFHAEATENRTPIVGAIHLMGAASGIVLGPPTGVQALHALQAPFDYVVVMGRVPGEQGVAFDRAMLQKIADIHEHFPTVPIEVDGGMNPETIPEAVNAGANVINVGSYIWSKGRPRDRWNECVEATK